MEMSTLHLAGSEYEVMFLNNLNLLIFIWLFQVIGHKIVLNGKDIYK
jgi:hypothetical protein